MRRREFIAGLGSAAAWPVVARAQQLARPVIGYLDSSPKDATSPFMNAFHQGLTETGYVDGRNVAIEYRSAEAQYDRLPALAADLVRRQVTVIAATGVSLSALAAKTATTTLPIVFWLGGDPVKLGLVTSLNKPGGNITGVTALSNELSAKRLELFRQLLPNATKTAVLVNPSNPNLEFDLGSVRNAARTLSLELPEFAASTEGEIDAAVAKLVEQGAAALFIVADQFFTDRRSQLAALAAHHAIPISGPGRPWVAAGALMSYSDARSETARQFGTYVGRILRGERPADLPVLQPTKFELVINLKTAKALGLTIPETLLATADEVIQ